MVNWVFFVKKLDRNLLRSTTFEHLTFEQTTYHTKCYNHRNWFVCISSLFQDSPNTLLMTPFQCPIWNLPTEKVWKTFLNFSPKLDLRLLWSLCKIEEKNLKVWRDCKRNFKWPLLQWWQCRLTTVPCNRKGSDRQCMLVELRM